MFHPHLTAGPMSFMQVAAITSAKFYTDGEPRTEVTLRPLSNDDVARYKA